MLVLLLKISPSVIFFKYSNEKSMQREFGGFSGVYGACVNETWKNKCCFKYSKSYKMCTFLIF